MIEISAHVLFLRSSDAGKVPTIQQLQYGQIAINPTDRKTYTLTKDGLSVVQLGLAPSDMAAVAFSGKFTDLTDAPAFSPYTLPAATATALGGVKIGAGVTVDGTGLITADVLTVAGRKGNVVLQGQDVGIPNDLMANNVVQLKYIPSSITGAMVYKGSFKPSGAALPAPAIENNGWLYVVAEAGSVTLPGDSSPTTLQVGDWVISNGANWQRIPNVSGLVTSVNGQTGDVVITLTTLGAATVASTGKYSDLLSIPTSFPPSAHTHPAAQITGLATVATTGNFNDLINPPQGITTANIAVSVSAEVFLSQDVSYLFTRPAQFPANFTASMCQATLFGASTSSVNILKNGTQVGTITITSGVGTFASLGGATSFASGDKLTYHWNSNNIQNISINLQGTWL